MIRIAQRIWNDGNEYDDNHNCEWVKREINERTRALTPNTHRK